MVLGNYSCLDFGNSGCLDFGSPSIGLYNLLSQCHKVPLHTKADRRRHHLQRMSEKQDNLSTKLGPGHRWKTQESPKAAAEASRARKQARATEANKQGAVPSTACGVAQTFVPTVTLVGPGVQVEKRKSSTSNSPKSANQQIQKSQIQKKHAWGLYVFSVMWVLWGCVWIVGGGFCFVLEFEI